MTKEEVLVTPFGEMTDMLNCQAIDNGAKQKSEKLSMEQILFEMI